MRKFVGTALIVTALGGAASAQTSTSVQQGGSVQQTLNINGSVGSACVLSAFALQGTTGGQFSEGVYTFQSTPFFWTQTQNLPTGRALPGFNVRCNLNTQYNLSWTAQGLGSPNPVTNHPATNPRQIRLYLDGDTSNPSLGNIQFRLARGNDSQTGPGNGGFSNPQTATVLAGQEYRFRASFAITSVPQSLPAGVYTNTITLTLSVVAPSP